MKKLLIFLFVLCFQTAKSQVYQLMPQYGYDTKRMNFDSTLSIPTFCGVPSLKSNVIKKAAIAYDSCNKRFYYYDPKLLAWDTIKGGPASSIDTTSLSNRINQRIDSLKRTGDSVFARKNGVWVFQYKDSVGGGDAPTLQSVTDNDNITTNDIYINSLYLYDGSSDAYANINLGEDLWNFNSSTTSTKNFTFSSSYLNANRTYSLPDGFGVIPLQVNGIASNTNGVITLPLIDSLKRSTDSIFARKNGMWNFQYKDSVGSGTSGILHGTASGTDTYTTTISGVTSYSDADAYLIRFTNGNTTGATLNINGLGAINLYRNNDGLLIGGDIWAGAEMLCVYNSSLPGFQCIGTSSNSLYAYVTNGENTTLTKGQVVYAYSGTGDRLIVKLASNKHDSLSARSLGVVYSSSIGANQKGVIIIEGQLDNLSILPTSTWSDGDIVYLDSTLGGITKTKPVAPNHLVYVGIVTSSSNGNSGRMYVKIQNGYELGELHDVRITNPLNGQFLVYSDTQKVWKNYTISAGSTDTTSLSNRINQKLNISDTATMLSPYLRKADTTLILSPYLRKADTTAMLTPYMRKSDTTSMLSPYERKYTSAYSMKVNNTNAGANSTETTYKQFGTATYSGTATWTGTTAPSGATNHSYSWEQVGKLVTLRITLVYGTAGSALTQVSLTLPSDCPTPEEPAGIGAATDVINYGSGVLTTALTATGLATISMGYSALRVNAADNGYDIVIARNSGNYRYAYATIQYFAQ